MASNEPLLSEGLPIRRVGAVTQATVTLWANDDPQAPARQRQERVLPIALPAQFEMSGGWQLTHRCPSSGAEVQQNSVVPLFHDTRYLKSLCLHAYYLRNTGLLDSIASVFDHLKVGAGSPDELYRYVVVPPPVYPSGFGGTPNLLYYKPLQGTGEQFLLLYDEGIAPYGPNEHWVVDPSFVNVYELVQVELDEALFLRLLQEALNAGYRARP